MIDKINIKYHNHREFEKIKTIVHRIIEKIDKLHPMGTKVTPVTPDNMKKLGEVNGLIEAIRIAEEVYKEEVVS